MVSACSIDPLGFDAGDSNLYRYVNNSPTNATDPSGLWTKQGVISVLQQSPTGNKTLFVLRHYEQKGLLKIFSADLRYKDTLDPPKGLTTPPVFTSEVAKNWTLRTVFGFVRRENNPALPGNPEIPVMYLDNNLSDFTVAWSLSHEIQHVAQGPLQYDPKKHEFQFFLDERFNREYQAHVVETQFLLEYPKMISKDKLGASEMKRLLKEFIMKDPTGTQWVVNYDGIKQYVQGST